MMETTKLEHLFEKHAGVLTYREAVAAGINPRLLSEWVEEGKAERVQRGVYRLVDAPAFTFDTWLELNLRIPKGVICLLSAAMVHELTTFVPSEVFMALPNKAWRPKIEYPPVRYFYFSGSAYDYGIEDYKTGAGTFKLYSLEKTIADLLRYRNKLGQNLFLEALKTYLGTKNFRIPKLLEAARACGVEKLMLDYTTTVLA
jgi:predicted transcriptional regulator of viral defense system